MDNTRFTNNFREAFSLKPGKIPTQQEFKETFSLKPSKLPTQEELKEVSLPNATKGQMSKDYGKQQNIIGLAALTALTSFIAPEVVPFLLGGTVLKSKKREPMVRGVRIESDQEPDVKITDPSPSIFLNNLRKIPGTSSLDDALKVLEENSRILEEAQNNLKKLRAGKVKE